MFDITLPVLEALMDGKPIHKNDLADYLAVHFKLTTAERSETTPSGIKRFSNRVTWACVELKGAGLINKRKGIVSITDDGRKMLEKKPKRITRTFLKENSPPYQQWLNRSAEPEGGVRPEPKPKSPLDVIDEQYAIIRNSVKMELLERISDKNPEFFEAMALKLVRAMGYGVSYEVLGGPWSGPHKMLLFSA